jgi:LPS-assembly protein
LFRVRPRSSYVIKFLGFAGLVSTLAHTAYAATTPVPSNKPLGILLSPQIIGNNDAQDPVNVPAQEDPPLGILLHSTTPTTRTTVTVPSPSSIPVSNENLTTFPGYSKQIETPNSSNDRPLGLLISPTTETQPSAQSPITTVPQQSPTQPPVQLPTWQTIGQSEKNPLGTLFAPSPSLPPVASERQATKQVSPTITPVPEVPVWTTSGQTGSLPLGTLFAPDTPLPVKPAVKEATSKLQQPASTNVEQPNSENANFSADTMTYDRDTEIVTAQGNVEIHHLERSLRADKVIFDRDTGIIQAIGGIALSEPGGEKIYAERIEISGDLKDGIIQNIGVILKDKSRLAGNGAKRTDGLVTEFSKGVYSPCSLCVEDPSKPPLWQIKAVRVIHDKNRQVVEYRDAWVEMFGYPVLYTPYFRHPDPTVRRQSGFLFPSIGNSSDLGTIVQTPYFWNISPHEDLTATPMLMTNANPALNFEYRKKMLKGEIEAQSSITKSDDGDDASDTEKGIAGIRGFLTSKGRFDINNTWRWGFDANRASDDTYMRRYGFASPGSLNSKIYTEAFRQKNYFSANAHTFQGLETNDVQDETPIILPLIDFNHKGDRDRFGGTTDFDFNFLALTRKEGTDTRRLSMRTRWERPVVGSLGDIYTLSVGLNGGLYHTNSLSRGSATEDYSGVSYRVVPEASLDWRLPFVKSRGNISQTLEPIASFMWSPYGGNSTKTPNEDSNELEFDDTNLFSTNRFSGLDRVEGGPRFAYGLKWGVFGSQGGSTRVFVGQSYRPKTDDTYSAGSGLEDNFSDIVSRVDIAPSSVFKLSYRSRFAAESFSPNRNEIDISAGVPALDGNINYVFLDRQSDSDFSGREEANFGVNSKINRFWRTRIHGRRDMAASEFRSAGFDLVYEDECVVFTTSATRTFFEDRDIEPTDSITFRLLLKTLGEVHSGFSQS